MIIERFQPSNDNQLYYRKTAELDGKSFNTLEAAMAFHCQGLGIPENLVGNYTYVCLEHNRRIANLSLMKSPSSLVSGNIDQRVTTSIWRIRNEMEKSEMGKNALAKEKFSDSIPVPNISYHSKDGEWYIHPIFLLKATDEELEKKRIDMVSVLRNLRAAELREQRNRARKK